MKDTSTTNNNNIASRWLSVAVGLMFAGAFFSRCASIGSLEGGPYDTLPPIITHISPMDYTTNFKGDKVTFMFDEYIQLKNQQKEVFTSPAMKKKPLLTIRGKSLIIELRDDSLKPNTTYSIELGSALADNNEGNPLHGMRYVFSTGDRIDSLYMSGYTEDSQMADSLGKTFIYFFEADSIEAPDKYDSTMFKYQPSKIARSATNGIFIAQNLKPVDYRVYAFFDSNDNQTYEPSLDKIGFLDSVYNPSRMPGFSIWYDSVRRYVSADPQLYFRMFMDVSFSNQKLNEQKRPEQHKVELQFNAARPEIRSITFDSIPEEDIIIEPMTKGRDTLALWLKSPSELLPDTLRGKITYMRHDSLRRLQEVTEDLEVTWRLVESKEQERERERLEKEKRKAEEQGKEWKEPPRRSTFRIVDLKSTAEVIPDDDFALEFATPLTKFDSTAIVLRSWSEKGDTLREKIQFIPDTVSIRKWRLRTAWQPTRRYQLYIPTDALADITGEGNDSLKVDLTVADKEKYATMTLNVVPRVAEARYIVQILNENGGTVRELKNLGAGSYKVEYIPAGEMRMRIIEDLNANGEWDAGNMVERRQGERSELYKNEQEEEIFTTKTGWEFDITLDMNRFFAPVTMEQLIERLNKREQARLIKAEEERREREAKEKKENGGHSHGGMMGGAGGLGGMMGGAGGIGGMMGGSGGGMGGMMSGRR